MDSYDKVYKLNNDIYQEIATIDAPQEAYIDEDVINGGTYYYRLQAFAPWPTWYTPERAVIHTEGTQQTDTTPPGEISNLAVIVDDRSIQLSWVNPTDLDFSHVEIWYGQDNSPNNNFSGFINNNATSITGLINETEYTVLIKTVDGAGNISDGKIVKAIPKAQNDTTNPTVTIVSGPSGNIDITNPTFTFTGVDNNTATNSLVYSTYLGGHETMDSWTNFSSSTSLQYSNLAIGTYTFSVRSKDQAGNISEQMDRIFTITLQGISITEPSSSTEWEPGDNNVDIEWITGNDNSELEIYLFKGSTFMEAVNHSTSNDGSYGSFDVPLGISPGTDYRIRIRSLGNSSNVVYSPYFEISQPPQLSAPTGLAEDSKSHFIVLDWNSVSNADEYVIYRWGYGHPESGAVEIGRTSNTYFNDNNCGWYDWYYKVAAVDSYNTIGQFSASIDSTAKGTSISLGSSLSGMCDYDSEKRSGAWFKLYCNADETYTIETSAHNGGYSYFVDDTILYVYDSVADNDLTNDNTLVYNDDGGVNNYSLVNFTPTYTGYYWIYVESKDITGSNSYGYFTIEVY